MKNKIMNNIISAVTNRATNRVASTAMNLLKNKFIYTVDMSSAGVMNILQGLRRVFPETCEYVNFMQWENSTDGYRIDIGPSVDNSMMSSQNESSMVTYHGTLIVLTIESAVDSSQNRYNFHVYLSCIRTAENISNVRELINRIIRYGRKRSIEDHLIMTYGPRMMSRELYGNLRSFDDVFISDADERLLKESLDAFVSKRNWYIEHNIGYHFGILLYGVPGSGKSSLAQAISEYINAKTMIVSGDNLMDIPDQVYRGFISSDTNGADKFQTLIVEDVDCGLTIDASMRRMIGGAIGYDSKDNKDDGKRTNGLASVLNQLDGINSLSNTVYVFTTNYIDKLDPALIRPGRIDLKIEIGYVTTETFNKFTKKHYNKTVDPDMKIKDGLTFAELQTYVMKEYSFDQIVDIVRA